MLDQIKKFFDGIDLKGWLPDEIRNQLPDHFGAATAILTAAAALLIHVADTAHYKLLGFDFVPRPDAGSAAQLVANVAVLLIVGLLAFFLKRQGELAAEAKKDSVADLAQSRLKQLREETDDLVARAAAAAGPRKKFEEEHGRLAAIRAALADTEKRKPNWLDRLLKLERAKLAPEQAAAIDAEIERNRATLDRLETLVAEERQAKGILEQHRQSLLEAEAQMNEAAQDAAALMNRRLERTQTPLIGLVGPTVTRMALALCVGFLIAIFVRVTPVNYRNDDYCSSWLPGFVVFPNCVRLSLKQDGESMVLAPVYQVGERGGLGLFKYAQTTDFAQRGEPRYVKLDQIVSKFGFNPEKQKISALRVENNLQLAAVEDEPSTKAITTKVTINQIDKTLSPILSVFHINGREVSPRQAGRQAHILPLFANEVRASGLKQAGVPDIAPDGSAGPGGREHKIDAFAEAYAAGFLLIDTVQTKIVKADGTDTDYLGYLGTLLDRACPQSPLRVRVHGYASETIFEGVENSKELNYFLAEGRRAAVLEKLGFKDGAATAFLGGADRPNAILVDSEDRPLRLPPQGRWTDASFLAAINDQLIQANANAGLPNGNFAGYREMSKHLVAWRTEGDDDVTDEHRALQEAFSRSVVIEIPDGQCEPTTVARADAATRLADR